MLIGTHVSSSYKLCSLTTCVALKGRVKSQANVYSQKVENSILILCIKRRFSFSRIIMFIMWWYSDNIYDCTGSAFDSIKDREKILITRFFFHPISYTVPKHSSQPTLLTIHKNGFLSFPTHPEMSINSTVLHLNISGYYAAPALTYSKRGSQSN